MKNLLKKYGHIWAMGYGLIYLPWFFHLEQTVVRDYHVMHVALDDKIPFNEYFIVPYLLWMWLCRLCISFLQASRSITGSAPFYLPV